MDTTGTLINWAQWQAPMPATLLFIVQDGKVLLIEKQRGIGAGKINGPGGKIDPGESSLACAIRETEEELCITAESPRKMGELCFAMSDIPDIHCHVYMAESFTGTPTATEEAIPLWTSIDEIPYEKMWDDDQFWLPQMLAGETFIGRFQFVEETILWQDVQFGSIQDQWTHV